MTERRATIPLSIEAVLPPLGAFEEWSIACATWTNVLVMARDDTIRLLADMLDSGPESVVVWHPGARLELPRPDYCGTLLLNRIDVLSQRDQARLLTWLEVNASRAQVVSTTARMILPLIESGAFLDRLYYRLNLVVCDIR